MSEVVARGTNAAATMDTDTLANVEVAELQRIRMRETVGTSYGTEFTESYGEQWRFFISSEVLRDRYKEMQGVCSCSMYVLILQATSPPP